MAASKLRIRSTDFAVRIIKLCESIKGHYSLVNQMERAATSIGANIREANYAHGKADFMAKLQKAADAPAVELPRGKNGKGKGGKTPHVDAKALQAWQSFAKELFPTLAGQPIAVVGDGFLLEPPALLPAAKLHVLRAGVPAGRAAKGRFEPAHALFMAYGAQCTNCEELTLADPRTAAWLRGEEIEAQTAQNGWCAVLVDGFPLGGGKASGGRIKNHYPKALRNLK